jgi:hypothetical protein
MKRLAILAVSALFTAAIIRAEDNTSTLITNLTDNAYTNYYVGYSGTNNSLTTSAGGILTNIQIAYMGYSRPNSATNSPASRI